MSRATPSQEALWDPQWFNYNDAVLEHGMVHHEQYPGDDLPERSRDFDLLDLLEEATSALPEHQRELVRARLHEQLTFHELAVAHDWKCGDPAYIDRKKAYREVHKALDALRDEIEERVDGWDGQAATRLRGLLKEAE